MLSLLKSELSALGPLPMLCYYINDTESIQTVRVMHRTACHLERIVSTEERILFEAFPESRLEMHSNGSKLDEIDCKLLQINEIEEFGRNNDAATEYLLEEKALPTYAGAPLSPQLTTAVADIVRDWEWDSSAAPIERTAFHLKGRTHLGSAVNHGGLT